MLLTAFDRRYVPACFAPAALHAQPAGNLQRTNTYTPPGICHGAASSPIILLRRID
jgi:hypothetical protein